MKIKVEKKAWYGLCLLEEGEVVDYDGDEVPVWGTLASGEEVAQNTPAKNEGYKTPEGLTITVQNAEGSSDDVPPPSPEEENETPEGENEEQEENEPEQDETPKELTPEELVAQDELLERLRDLAVAHDVWRDNIPVTPEEEIAILKEELTKKGINVEKALEV